MEKKGFLLGFLVISVLCVGSASVFFYKDAKSRRVELAGVNSQLSDARSEILLLQKKQDAYIQDFKAVNLELQGAHNDKNALQMKFDELTQNLRMTSEALRAAQEDKDVSQKKMDALEKELIDFKNKEQTVDQEKEKFLRQIVEEGYFTIGSTKEDVHKVQGAPWSMVGSYWSYGERGSNNCSVVFGPDGRVKEVTDTQGVLKFK